MNNRDLIRSRLNQYMEKQASTYNQEQFASLIGRSVAGSVAPGLTDLAGLTGLITGLSSGKVSPEKLKARDPVAAMVPGIGDYYTAQRETQQAKETGRWSPTIADILGRSTSVAGTTALGAGLGAGLGSVTGNPDDIRAGTVIGLFTGAGLNLIGLISGMLARRRRAEEQKDIDEQIGVGGYLGRYLVPGVASYQSVQRGRASED